MDMNSLKQYMDLYDSIMPRTPDYGPSMFGGGESAMNQANDAGRRLSFALRMAGGGQPGTPTAMPDYFGQGGQGGPNPYTPRVQALQAQPFMDQPERASVVNHMARYLK